MERYARQEGIIARELREADVHVVGVGMLGSWTALALARCARSVHVWDFDVVEEANVGCQAYIVMDVGAPKVDMLANMARGLPVLPHHERFPLDRVNYERIMVSAVDSFTARKELAMYTLEHPGLDLFVDTRAMGELAVTCIVPRAELEDYIANLPTDESAPDAPCGFQGTAYTGMLVAARTVSQINAYYHGCFVPAMLVEELRTGQVVNHVSIKGGSLYSPIGYLNDPVTS